MPSFVRISPALIRKGVFRGNLEDSRSDTKEEAENDIAVVKDWLGHADVKTTILYVEVGMERKRQALEKLPPPDGGAPSEAPKWKQPDIMKFLNKCSNKTRYVA